MYASMGFINPFGLEVKIKCLGYYDAFELAEDPTGGVELFSSTTTLLKNINDKKILTKAVDLDQKIDNKIVRKLSLYFRNKEFNKSQNEKRFIATLKKKRRLK